MKQSLSDNFTITGLMRATVRDAKTGTVKRIQEWKQNLNPTVLFEVIARLMGDSTADFTTTENLLINYISLGSNTTTPALTDTQLGTEVYRNLVASMSVSGKLIYITGFFNDTEVSGTFREAGLHSGGTGSANTGTLVSHVGLNITKSTSETLTIDWIINVGS